MAPKPSSGGTGRRLKTPRSRFNENITLRKGGGAFYRSRTLAQDNMCEVGRVRMRKEAHPEACVDSQSRENGKRQICSGQGHPCGSARMALRPKWIERRAGPTHHPASDDVGKDGEHNHSKWFAANVRDWVKRDLSAMKRGEVASEFSG